MLIRTDTVTFDTDNLLMIDRIGDGLVLVDLGDWVDGKAEVKETLKLEGVSAQQAWCQITEHAETV